eukprot:6177783-Alexandrium_andersonii.AAC.1
MSSPPAQEWARAQPDSGQSGRSPTAGPLQAGGSPTAPDQVPATRLAGDRESSSIRSRNRKTG